MEPGEILGLLRNKQEAPPGPLSPQLNIPHSSAATCVAAPCSAVRCCFMLRCALFRNIPQRQVSHAKYHVPRAGMYVLFIRLVAVVKVHCPLSVPTFFPPPNFYTRSADQHVISPTITQHSGAQNRAAMNRCAEGALGSINSLVPRNHWPILSAPLTLDVHMLHSSLREG